MKILKKFLSYIISPFALGLAVTIGIVSISSVYYARYQDSTYDGESRFFDLLREIHQKTIDFRLLDRGEAPGHPDVAILGIDEASVEQEGRWPWPREKIAKVVDRAISYGAKVIAFDIIFAEADSNSSRPTLERLQRQLASRQALTPEASSTLRNELAAADSDAKFGEIISKHADRLVMGAYFEEFTKRDLENTSPYSDECVDHLFRRTPAYGYWNKDQRKPAVADAHAGEQVLPQALAEHLSGYMGFLEGDAIGKWLSINPDHNLKLSEKLANLGFNPAEVTPDVFLQPYLLRDRDTMKLVLEQLLGVPSGEQSAEGVVSGVDGKLTEKVDAIFWAFDDVLSQRDQAIILAKIRDATTQYCYRFLSDSHDIVEKNDELLRKDSFKAIHMSDEYDYSNFSWRDQWTKANQSGSLLPTATLDEFLAKLRSRPLLNQVTPVSRWWVNIPVLEAGTKYTGFFNAHLDSDGTIRRNMFLAHRGRQYATSLALTAFNIAKGTRVAAVIAPLPNDPIRKGIPLETEAADGSGRKIAGFRLIDEKDQTVLNVPVDASGRMTINYHGPKYTFPHVSAAEVLGDSDKITIQQRHFDETGQLRIEKTVDKAEFFKDKILIFGATATGIFDLRVTPFEENFPGVETHANMLSNLLVEHARATGQAKSVTGMPGFLRAYPELESRYMLFALLGIGITLSALLSYFGSVVGLAITLSSIASVYAVDKLVLFEKGMVVTVMFPMGLISGLFVTLTFYKYFTEERTKRELKGTFEKYVSPSIVAEVLADPSNIELGGKKMELTVMFSDVRGFTTISEKLDPRALSNFLNEYLTPMTDLVFANKGTLDKYMGDAVMAFWGAPIHFPDHAKHACRCALQMIEKLKELQVGFRAKGLPEIDIGIGLNTGEMSVGNMGSNTVRSYTVMGDAVNLGSRLEGINKEYGTRIIISEFTYAAVKDSFVCREVDWVRVKGKTQPVRIFELIAERSVPSETVKLLELFNEGFAAYHAKDWNKGIELFTAALNLKPDDEPSSLYLERCQEYLKNPPPEDWDGVFIMTTK